MRKVRDTDGRNLTHVELTVLKILDVRAMQNSHIQNMVCHHPLKGLVLPFKFLKLLECFLLHAPILALPTLVGSNSHPKWTQRASSTRLTPAMAA